MPTGCGRKAMRGARTPATRSRAPPILRAVPDPHDLDRFVRAQQSAYSRALSELRAGRKQTHWMWFVFPQLAGLGTSETARRYAIRCADEAAAYLRHPVLGPRLVAVSNAALDAHAASARALLGTPDDLKLRSSATLFAAVSPPGSVFEALLERYYDGKADEQTLRLLRSRQTA